MQYKDAKSKPLDMLGDKYPMSYTRFYQIWKGEEVCTNTWKLSLADSENDITKPVVLAQQILNFLMIICSALMLWKTLSLYTNSESPIVVVLSGSMEPAFFRGDLLFLTMPKEPVKVGDIVVFKIQGREVPIVHRVIKLHNKAQSDKQYILTKGDNNQVDDRGLYNKNQFWIHKEHLVGKVTG
ncbi:125_t:CDS:2 [Entrophospora sp. SA101]|nr:125_t:CDS:2 [Entrophospora sp. SA101]